MTRRTASRLRLVVAIVMVVLIAVWLVRSGSRSGGGGEAPTAGAPAVSSEPDVMPSDVEPGPARVENGIPGGFAHSEAGARAAAVAYVLTGQRLLELAPTQVADAIGSMTASASTAAQVADAQRQLSDLRDVLSDGHGPIRYAQAVLAVRMEAYAPERARVSVWSVGVLSRQGVAAPQAGWTTSTFELVWERGDWKTWSETVTAGPAPVLNAGAAPATSEELEQRLSGFLSWRWGW